MSAKISGEAGRRVRGWVFAAIVVLIMLSGGIAAFYTDVLWFRDIGQEPVFWTVLTSRVLTGLAFGVAAFVLLGINLAVARRMAPGPATPVAYPEGPLPPQMQIQQGFIRMRETLDPYARWILLGFCAFFAVSAALTMATEWQTLRLALSAVPFGTTDPQFGMDVGFFVFQLPALRVVADWLYGTLFAVLVFTAVVHLYGGAIRLDEKLQGFDPHVKAHLSVLAGLIVASKAFDYWLRIYELNWSPRGQVTGASYTDIHAQMPAYWILIFLAGATLVALLFNIRFKGWRLPAISLGVWVAAAVIVGSIYPALVQQFRVTPNELAAEAPYIERNIKATREAFDLASVRTEQFPANTNLTAADIAEATATIGNVRLWDPNHVGDSYKQLQEIRFYYDFNDVDIDRYEIGGQKRQVLISVREMSVDQLSENARTWINQHLVYTHGYGIVMSPVNRASADGLPTFFIKDLPPSSTIEHTVTQPAIYFGERSNAYAIVGTTQEEFDYPVGGQNARTRYSGKSGIPIGSPLNRLAFAMRFGAPEIIFSSAITPESRVLFRRDIADRLGTLAPWLWLDRDPYPVLIDGRVVWIQDAYTYSRHYPYSQQQVDDVNYMRNSVKVVIDAYDGTTTLYGVDDKDPVLATYRRIFPGLVTDGSKMPEGLRDHWRYPEDLFAVQAQVYTTYHMSDPQVFYNKEDQWAIPGADTDAPMAPYYVLMQLPGEDELSFILMQPFTPRTKDNMIGWMAANCDANDYGDRLVYNFPKQRLILGPEQVSARANQEPEISKELTLLDQQGSRVIRGNMLVIPLRDGIVYIQPLYLRAEASPMPELKRVIVAYSDKVVMEPDLATALLRVFGEVVPGVDEGDGGGREDDAAGEGASGEETSTVDAAMARDLYEQALDAQKSGDWAEYGKLIEELGKVLDELAE